MDLPDIQLAQLKLMIDSSLIEICADPHDVMGAGTDSLGKIAGPESRELVTQVKRDKKPIEKYLHILQFFNAQDGDLEFTNMLGIMGGLGP